LARSQISFRKIASEIDDAFEELSKIASQAQVQYTAIDEACSELAAKLNHCMAILRKYYIEYSGRSGSPEDPAIVDVCRAAYDDAWSARRFLVLEVEIPLGELMFKEHFPDSRCHFTAASLRDIRSGLSHFVGKDVRDLLGILKGMDRLLQLQQGKIVRPVPADWKAKLYREGWPLPFVLSFITFVLVFLTRELTPEQLLTLILSIFGSGAFLSCVIVWTNYRLTVNVYGNASLDFGKLPPMSELEKMKEPTLKEMREASQREKSAVA